VTTSRRGAIFTVMYHMGARAVRTGVSVRGDVRTRYDTTRGRARGERSS
jgi:hypothetical protein